MSTQPQQPVVVYPNNVPAGQAPPSHSHSDGSFGPVFIVLAMIIVISAIACFIGRMCNRWGNQTKPSGQNRNHDLRPKERDVEFGLGSSGRIPGAEPPGGHDEPSKGFKMPGNEDVGGPRMPEKGDPIPRIRIPGNGDPRGRRVHANGDPTGFRIPVPKPVDDGPLKPDE
ncbi:hypothetical protein F3Y22_tig00113725pilonHSYRG00741 [Hibiscus syriacus]|uniref:Uncharacterized protein n=1 Tax=Hibiscus syriacus TaxID=106335 RepID=A0A6A2X3D1_HIBSY|nr:uncharacterized protein LOC120187531 [Hibiscus syriacus]KAE8661515.1 hypothetical protein F3Y22_tig00113725pilonHSYRG00741 [Hibiscus syriacus]